MAAFGYSGPEIRGLQLSTDFSHKRPFMEFPKYVELAVNFRVKYCPNLTSHINLGRYALHYTIGQRT
jgi:hypothetical protein